MLCSDWLAGRSSFQRLARGVLLGWFGVLGTGAAAAQAAAIALEWSAPPACGEHTWIVQEAQRLAGTTPSEPLLARASVWEEAPGLWVLHLQVGDAERTLRGDSCTAVAQAVIVTLALAINPRAEIPEEPVATPPARVPDITHTPPGQGSGATTKRPGRSRAAGGPRGAPRETLVANPGRQPLPQRRRAPAEPWRARLSAGVGVTAGLLPRLAPDLGIGVGVTRGEVSGWVVGRWAPPSPYPARVDGDAGATLRLYEGQLLGCWHPSALSWTAWCLGGGGTVVHGRGFGIDDPRPGFMTWPSLIGAGVVRAPLTRHIGIRSTAQVGMPLERPTAFVERNDAVARPARLGGRVGLEVEVGFP